MMHVKSRATALRERQSPLLHSGTTALRRTRSASGKEWSLRDASLSALMPSVLDKAFKGEL